MKLPKYRTGDPILPSEADATMAEATSHVLASYLESQESHCTIVLMEDETDTRKTVEIPAIAMQLLLEILVHTAEGKPVKITPYTKELHINQAADILGVSITYLVGLLKSGEIPYWIDETVYRMRYQDVIEYKKRMRAEQMKGMDELVAQSQVLGL